MMRKTVAAVMATDSAGNQATKPGSITISS